MIQITAISIHYSSITKLVKTTITDTDSDWTALTVNLIKNLSFSCSQIARIIESLEIARLQSLDGVIIHSRIPNHLIELHSNINSLSGQICYV